MEITIRKAVKKKMELEAPKSRSYSNRALAISALAKGKSKLKNALTCDDTTYMIEGLKKLGIKITKSKDEITVDGCNGKIMPEEDEIYTGNSGTTMRFLTAISALSEKTVKLTGDSRMKERPIGELGNALNELGVKIITTNGHPPVTATGQIKGGKTSINGAVSSQFVSAILMVAPYAEKEVTLSIEGELTSKPYIDSTIECMECFNGIVKNNNYKQFKIDNKRKYLAKKFIIEGDYSNSSYFWAAAAITKKTVRITGLNPKSKQGDRNFIKVLERMGCKTISGKGWIEVTGAELKGIDIDMNSMPDTVQTLAVVAAFAKGKTTIKNIHNLRVKETDRIKALANELKKIGADAKEGEDHIEIIPQALHANEINTYNDHRMAMSFAIAGLELDGMVIKGAECVSKTFPEFFSEIKRFY